MFTIDEIKKIKYSYELFGEDIEEIKSKYVELMKEYHPDLHGQKAEYIEASEKINKLYKQAEEDINNGIWEGPGFISLKCIDGSYKQIKYKISHKFELGEMYIGDKIILYLINNKYEKLVFNAIDKLKNIKYSNYDMEMEFKKCIPNIQSSFKTITGEVGVILKKEEDLILLRDLLDYYNGKLTVDIVRLVLNSLYNIECFIKFNGLIHNGISIDNYFISIKNNYGALLGGWWYSIEDKGDIKSSIDLDAIRILGRKILGDESGDILFSSNSMPKDLARWLMKPSDENPFEEYCKWNNLYAIIKDIKYKKDTIDNDDLYNSIEKN